MIECFSPEVRDHLPDLAHGRLGEIDTATMLAHVEACRACAAELELLREIRRTAPIAPLIDAARVVGALPAPKVSPALEAPTRASGRSRMWKVLATAAVVAIATVAGTQLGSTRVGLGVPGAAQLPVTAEANSSAVRSGAVEQSLALVSSMQDLTDDQLQELLVQLDDIETIPSAEPEVTAVGIDGDMGAVR